VPTLMLVQHHPVLIARMRRCRCWGLPTARFTSPHSVTIRSVGTLMEPQVEPCRVSGVGSSSGQTPTRTTRFEVTTTPTLSS